MKHIVETWTITATSGTIGVDEADCHWAIIERGQAKTAKAAIAFVGAKTWTDEYGNEPVSIDARETWAFADDVGWEETGCGGSLAAPDFDSYADAEEYARELAEAADLHE